MTFTATFTVPGEPVPKARARVTARGTFTPERTRAHTEAVQWAWNAAVKGHHDDGTARYRVDLLFICKSRVHADIDNIAKLVFDALNGLAWKDDWQVDEGLLLRRFSRSLQPCTIVTIRELGQP
jgi:Holliday junction resolvase RusA-like endonuclease